WLIADVPAEQRHLVSSALQALGWPCVSSGRLEPDSLEAARRLDPATAYLVVLAVQEVTRRISAGRPDIGARLRSISLLNSPSTVLEGIRIAEGLTLAVNYGPSILTAKLPYWHHESNLYVDSAFPLERAVAEFIDSQTNATCSGFFDLVWQQAIDRA